MYRSAHTAAFLVCIGILILGAAAHNFIRYYVAKDYPFHVFTACNPAVENCFVADPNSSDPTFQSGTYEKVTIDAAHAPRCLEQHTCTDFSCDGLGAACSITYCSHDALETGESCTAPSR